MMLVEEESMAKLEERGGMEFKNMEATMAEMEMWEGRIRVVENGWKAAIAVAIARETKKTKEQGKIQRKSEAKTMHLKKKY